MKKSFLIFPFLCLFAIHSFGWGATGHRVTASIAEQYLNAKSKKRLAAILGQESLAMVSTWMDEIRSDSTYNYTANWHWTTIPDGKRYEDVEHDQNLDGRIVIMVEKFSKELGTGKLSAREEREYLKMLIHMVGDIHQPLHVGKPGDKGGNDVKLTWFGGNSTLHRVWDSDMIDDSKLSYTELVQFLPKPDAATVKKLQSASIREWAMESVSVRSEVYNIGNGKLGYVYNYKYFGIAKRRLMEAGVRLAGILNQIYGK